MPEEIKPSFSWKFLALALVLGLIGAISKYAWDVITGPDPEVRELTLGTEVSTNLLKIAEGAPGKLTAKLESHLGTTEIKSYFKIRSTVTNTGNKSAVDIPIQLFLGTPDLLVHTSSRRTSCANPLTS